ncbi:hypothetical protein [Pedobacter sp. N23S346]|uniref:hypothetical protein n=1 Tax=Pedobacter sp. N23S346 TaxID=3402750 RepID=UPI003AC1F178
MRLFYIIFFLSALVSFASFANPKKNSTTKNQPAQVTSISKKSNLTLNPGITQDQESLQKNLISNAVAKILLDLFAVFLITLALFLPVKMNKSVLKRLKYKYWCLLKMLYPKHVFW